MFPRGLSITPHYQLSCSQSMSRYFLPPPRLLLVPCHVPVLFVANAAHDNEVMLLHLYADYSIPVKSSEWPNSIDIRSPQQSISISFLLHVLSMFLTLQFHVIFSWTYPSVKCKCPMTGTKQHVFKILY